MSLYGVLNEERLWVWCTSFLDFAARVSGTSYHASSVRLGTVDGRTALIFATRTAVNASRAGNTSTPLTSFLWEGTDKRGVKIKGNRQHARRTCCVLSYVVKASRLLWLSLGLSRCLVRQEADHPKDIAF